MKVSVCQTNEVTFKKNYFNPFARISYFLGVISLSNLILSHSLGMP